jgi:glucose uptake protein GlcU
MVVEPSTSVGVGFVLAIMSAVGNGTFAALSKLCPDVHPVHFNMLLSIGTLVSSFVFALLYPVFNDEDVDVRLDFVACLSGSLFVMANTFAFFAIPRIGIALAQGTWGGVALTVSFVWGTYGPKDILKVPKSFGGAYGGIVMILVGIVGLAQSEALARLLLGGGKGDRASLLGSNAPSDDYAALDISGDINERAKSVNAGNGERGGRERETQKQKLVGILCACLTGTFGGSILVPNQIGALKGQAAVASFGTGAFCTAMITTPLYFALFDTSATPTRFPRKCAELWPGVVAGIIWNIGNIMQIFAIPAIGFAVAGPINQCGLLISGLLGIFVFKEITGSSRIIVFFICSIVLVIGAFVLSASV